jgi:hypothetical protein
VGRVLRRDIWFTLSTAEKR